MKLRSIAGWFGILAGILVILMWALLLHVGQEPVIHLVFHAVTEFMTAMALVFGGIGLMKRWKHSTTVHAVSLGVLLYATLDNAGDYVQRNDWATMCLFAALFVVTIVFLVKVIAHREEYQVKSQKSRRTHHRAPAEGVTASASAATPEAPDR